MQDELRTIHREIGGTFICVTHDQGEAIALANRIAVMNAGRIVQEGTPQDIYHRPANVFVASFVGESNILKLVRKSGVCDLAGNAIDVPGSDGEVALMVRPGDIRIVEAGEPGDITVAGRIVEAVFMGDRLKLVITLEGGGILVVHQSQACEPGLVATGRPVFAAWSKSACRILERP
jgi:ABC-type Fe3+/spermidine/putrescine transport system ATPase subunit